MATAKIVLLPNGTKVSIEGEASEVAVLLDRLTASSAPAKKLQTTLNHRARAKPISKDLAANRSGPKALIEGLIRDGYFRKRRTIGDVQRQLEAEGNIYPQTSLSTPLLRLIRDKFLRRMKEKGTWVYVN